MSEALHYPLPCHPEADGYCRAHQRRHVGAELRWSLSPCETGAKYRQHWHAQAAKAGQRQIPVRCLYLGDPTGRTVECLEPG